MSVRIGPMSYKGP